MNPPESISELETLLADKPELGTMEVIHSKEDGCVQKKSLDVLRTDLVFQLETPEDLDWDYFLETALKAKFTADALSLNMKECERPLEDIILDAKVTEDIKL